MPLRAFLRFSYRRRSPFPLRILGTINTMRVTHRKVQSRFGYLHLRVMLPYLLSTLPEDFNGVYYNRIAKASCSNGRKERVASSECVADWVTEFCREKCRPAGCAESWRGSRGKNISHGRRTLAAPGYKHLNCAELR